MCKIVECFPISHCCSLGGGCASDCADIGWILSYFRGGSRIWNCVLCSVFPVPRTNDTALGRACAPSAGDGHLIVQAVLDLPVTCVQNCLRRECHFFPDGMGRYLHPTNGDAIHNTIPLVYCSRAQHAPVDPLSCCISYKSGSYSNGSLGIASSYSNSYPTGIV